MTVYIAIAALGCAVWFAQAGALFVHIARLRALSSRDVPEPARWPLVSALVPARDESRSIESALASRLADDYPALEVIAVDDRSTDGTGALIDAAASRDPRVRAVHVTALPDGWLGKVHALAEGAAAARGEWLLVSDGDVHLTCGGLKRAIAYCEAEGLDYLALVPEFRSRSFVFCAIWTVFMRVLGMLVDPAAVRDPRSRVAMGSGAFSLSRRSVFEATPGFEHVRMETADDVALGIMMKRAGARCDFANGRGIASVTMYDSVGEFFRGVEKNGGSFATTPLALAVGALALAGVFELSPFLALASGVVWLQALGAVTAVLATAAGVAALKTNTGRVLPALLWPLGWLLMAAGILRSLLLLHRRGGVLWRGTFYPRAQLAEGQRFRMF